jgi:hypothetical protein
MLSIGARLEPLYHNDSLSNFALPEYMNESHTSDSTIIPVDSNMTSTSILVALPLGEEVYNDLLMRWIVDPGSNTHVINSEAWMGWTREHENTEHQTINASSSSVEITA